MKIRSCGFARAAFRPADEPREPGPHVVFLGRSNVGKSSLINKLLGARGLARTSSQPGRTQSVNFYRVNGSFWFVDLPGYGYAKVPAAVRESWGPMVEGYLERRRERIALALLVLDARHAPTALDATMRDWLADRRIPRVLVATKADKLSGNGRAKARRALAGFAADDPAPRMLVSASNGTGIREIWKHLDRALTGPQETTGEETR